MPPSLTTPGLPPAVARRLRRPARYVGITEDVQFPYGVDDNNNTLYTDVAKGDMKVRRGGIGVG